MTDLRSLYKRGFPVIREILNREWDPIGVTQSGDVQDEYDTYIPVIWRLLIEGATDEAVAAHLGKIETEQMGLSEAAECNLQVARRLRLAVPRD